MIWAVDHALNRITMYRLVLYYTAGLLVAAFLLGFVGLMAQDPTALTFSFALIIGTCCLTNRLFVEFLRVPANTESFAITAIILMLIMPPVTAHDLLGVAGLIVASVVAIASKFVLAVGRKHIFNPVAIGIVASAFVLNQSATWCVGGNLTLFPFVLADGLLGTRKVQRFDTAGIYIVANLAITLATNMHIGALYLTPEMAFLVGNLFAYTVSPKGRFKLALQRIEKAAAGCYDFVFQPDRRLVFQAGQYLDWTLHVPNPDDRGNRRPFTIASASTEHEVRLGVKFYDGPSAFKRSLAAVQPGDINYGSQLAGNFTLPSDPKRKLAFIAGGIGVTPFRSMIQDLLDRREKRSIVMLYGNNKLSEIAYGDIFQRAKAELGLRIVYAVADPEVGGYAVHDGVVDETLIRELIPDYMERLFYLSGPRAMVVRFQSSLRALGVRRSRIRVDYFPGVA